MRLRILLVLPMSGAILAQAALDGSTMVRVVQTSAVLSGLVPYGLFSSSRWRVLGLSTSSREETTWSD